MGHPTQNGRKMDVSEGWESPQVSGCRSKWKGVLRIFFLVNVPPIAQTPHLNFLLPVVVEVLVVVGKIV